MTELHPHEDPALLARWFADVGSHELTLLLYAAWDPIGVGSDPAAASHVWGEYQSYAWRLAQQAAGGADDAQLAATLARVERDEMGLGEGDTGWAPPGDAGRDLVVPRLLRRWIVASVAAWMEAGRS